MPGPWEQFATPTEPQTTPPAADGPWTQFRAPSSPTVEPPSIEPKKAFDPSRYTMTGMKKEMEKKTEPGRGALNVAAVADMIISFPGQVLGTLVGTAESTAAAAGGATHEEVQQLRRESIEKYTEANPLNNPIHKAMVAAGYSEGYNKSDVNAVFDKIAGGIGKAGEWMEEKTNGIIGKGDFEDLANSAIQLAVPAAARGAGKLGKKIFSTSPDAPRTPIDEPVLRPDPSPLTPPKADTTPMSLAQQHIEETTGVKTEAERKAINAQRRADAKAAFAEDPLYADYLKNFAEGEVAKRTAPNEIEADRMEANLKGLEVSDLDMVEYLKAAKTGEVSKELLREPTDPFAVQAAKQQTKAVLRDELKAGTITGDHSFRGGSLGELRKIAKTGQLVIGTSAEGEAGISAATIGEGDFPVYGSGVGYIVPKKFVESSGRAGETLVDPKTDPKQLKYVVEGKVMNFNEMKEVVERGVSKTKTAEVLAAEDWLKEQVGGDAGGPVTDILKTPATVRTPEQILQLRRFRGQGGQIDAKLLARMAAVGIGTAAGLYLDPDHPVEGAVLGVTAGFFAGKAAVAPVKAGKAIADIFKPDKRLRMTEIADTHEVAIERAARAIWQKQMDIFETVRDRSRREAITNWLQGDKSIPLNSAEYKAALKAKDFFADMGKAGLDSGVLSNLIPDYVTNLWDLEGANRGVWSKLTSGPGMSEKTKFNLQRKITSIAEGKKLGLKPITEDVSVIMGVYGNSLSRTMANKQLMESLRNTKVPGAEAANLLMPAPVAPRNYVAVNHSQLRGQLVHPDIAKSMEFLFQQKTPTGILAGIEAVNTGIKRLTVSFSGFHAMALTHAFIGGGGSPLQLKGMISGSNKFLRMIREGGAGDMVDKAIEGGLKYSLDREALAVEDVGGAFYKGMDSLRGAVDEVIPGAGKLVKGVETVNRAVDHAMWSVLHPTMKLVTFSSAYEKLLKNNIEAHAKNPDVQIKSSKELSTIAASYSNDLFGGLNWRRMAEATKTELGRDAALTLLAPTGRRGLQLLLFAPDWTISTTRAALKAFGKGTGVKGLVKPQELADLHRQYLLRSALFYFTAGNALNYAMSGHSIFENKDPTTLELGDGRTMQFSKHMMEPVHWITKPGQQALNKLGFIPSEFAEQATGVEYLSVGGKAPKIEPTTEAHARHLLRRLVPIAVGQGEMGWEAGISGALGFPIYGKTEEERKAAKEEAKRKRIKKKDAAYEASRD